MKKFTLACLIMMSSLTSCEFFCSDYCNENQATNQEITKITNDEFVQGVVAVPTTVENGVSGVGIMRVFVNESLGDQKLLKGVVFKHEECGPNSIYRPFFFTIEEQNGIQFAKNIVNEIPTGSVQFQNTAGVLENLRMDLHVDHPTTTLHTKIHVVGQGSASNISATNGTQYVQIRVYNTTDPNQTEFDIYIPLSEFTPAINNNQYFANIIGNVNNQIIYSLRDTHTHRFD